MVGSYETLEPQEQASVAAPSPYQPLLEGRAPAGIYWRLSAHVRDADVCVDFSLGRSGRGGSVHRECKPKDHWETGWLANEGFAAFFGYAGLRAESMEILLVDGRSARVSPSFLNEADLSFFVVWVSCDGADVDRFRAFDSQGRERSRLRHPPGTPSDVCS